MKQNSGTNFLLFTAGTIFILLSLFLFIKPFSDKDLNFRIISISFILAGFALIAAFVKNKRWYFRPGWVLNQGLFLVLLGLLLLYTQGNEIENNYMLFSFWSLYTSVTQLSSGVQLRALEFTKWWWLICFGVLSLIMCVYFVTVPLFEFITIYASAGIYILIIGIVTIFETVIYTSSKSRKK